MNARERKEAELRENVSKANKKWARVVFAFNEAEAELQEAQKYAIKAQQELGMFLLNPQRRKNS